MNMNIIHNPSHQEKTFITDGLWEHNSHFHPVDIEPFVIDISDDNGSVVAGLIAQTWWGALEIQYLWVSEQYREMGYGRKMMLSAEVEARTRGCHMAYVDTFDFQAKAFYEKLGYEEYGSLAGHARKFTRHYLVKGFR
ncbi:GNAT family N-acetyltransferase [Erwinia amylovora]|uniref:GNAT family N-acetyltransferase n=1 Tax=Erwinia amylovora TaxID=552 RepID=UPI0014446029|nr:GNAT family N-acetyltransferase [Erwinia amylovora]